MPRKSFRKSRKLTKGGAPLEIYFANDKSGKISSDSVAYKKQSKALFGFGSPKYTKYTCDDTKYTSVEDWVKNYNEANTEEKNTMFKTCKGPDGHLPLPQSKNQEDVSVGLDYTRNYEGTEGTAGKSWGNYMERGGKKRRKTNKRRKSSKK